MVALLHRLGDALASPRARWLAPIAAVALTGVSLGNGLAFDDAFQRWRALGRVGPSLGERLDLFTFVPGDPAGNGRAFDLGFAPWFAAPDLRLSFFRPLSALLVFFDYTTLDRWPWLMHAESVALYAIVAALAVATYRRFLAPPIAALAGLLYAIDPAHGLPVGWLANRNAPLATAFALAALLAHDRARRDGRRAAAIAAPLFFAAALASGELALGALGYLIAHAVVIDRDPSRARRAIALAPYAIVLVAWQALYRLGGHGARGSALYLDPIASPVAFARAFPERLAALLLGLLGAPPSDAVFFAPPAARAALLALAVAVVSFVAWTLAPVVKRDPALRFFALGSILALLPAAATVPSDRLFFLAGLGSIAIVAHVIGAPLDATRAERGLRRFWIAMHLVVAPILLPLASLAPRVLGGLATRGASGIAMGPELADQTLVIVNAPTALFVYPLVFRDDVPLPRRVRLLASTLGPVSLRREGARTIAVSVDPASTADPVLRLFRDDARALREGDAIDVPGMHVDVTRATPAGRPIDARFTFDAELASRDFRVIAWDGARFVDYALPAVGERGVIAAR